MEIKAAETVSAERFCSPCLLLLWRWYREKPTAFHPCGATITYCSPMLENTIHHPSPAQWAESDGCVGTHRRLHLLQPQDGWMTPFSQFCLWHSGDPRWKNWISPVRKRGRSEPSRRCLLSITKMVQTKLAAHGGGSMRVGNRKTFSAHLEKWIHCTADSCQAPYFTGVK